MKKILIISFMMFHFCLAFSQNEISPLKNSNSVLFAKDVIIQNLPNRDQQGVAVCSAFNGWLYAVYSYTYHYSGTDFGAVVLLKSLDSGVSWDVLWDAPYTSGSRFTSLDIIATGDSISNIKVFLGLVASVNPNGAGDGMIFRYNANGDFESQLFLDSPVYFISLTSDFKYPASNTNPYSVGFLLSRGHSSTVQLDSIIFYSSSNGGQTLDNKKIVKVSNKWCQKVGLAYGRSLSCNNGRYFAVWEEKDSYNSPTGQIYTSHSEPYFNSAFTTPIRLDSIDPTADNKGTNPVIACQVNNIANDSANVTETILFDKYLPSGNRYEIKGLVNRKATVSNHFSSFSMNTSTNDQKQPSIVFNPYDSTFLATYYDSTVQKLLLLSINYNMGNPNLWQTLSSGYNDSTNLSNPFPKVRLNHGLQQAINAWSVEGTNGNGIAMFDAPYNTYTGIQRIIKPSPILKLVYPNPTSGKINILFELNERSNVSLNIISLEGRILKQIINKRYDKGQQSLSLDLSDLIGGAYLFNFTAGIFNTNGKIVVIK